MSSDEWRKRYIFSPVLKFSQAQFWVFERLGLGLYASHIANTKGFRRSEKTVYNHLDRMMRKCGFRSIPELRQLAMAFRASGLQRVHNPNCTPYKFA